MTHILTDEVVEIVARTIYCQMCGVTIDYDSAWAMCIRKDHFRAYARATLLAALPHIGEAFRQLQPSTAENPNEDAYQRGRFDGIMEYGRAIRAATKEASHGG